MRPSHVSLRSAVSRGDLVRSTGSRLIGRGTLVLFCLWSISPAVLAQTPPPPAPGVSTPSGAKSPAAARRTTPRRGASVQLPKLTAESEPEERLDHLRLIYAERWRLLTQLDQLNQKNAELANQIAMAEAQLQRIQATAAVKADAGRLLEDEIRALERQSGNRRSGTNAGIELRRAEYRNLAQQYAELQAAAVEVQQNIGIAAQQMAAQQSEIDLVHRQADQLRGEWLSTMELNGMLAAEDWQAALKVLDEWVVLEPQNPDPYFVRAIAFIRLGDLPRAARDLQKSVELTQQADATLLAWQGLLLSLTGSPQEALSNFGTALQQEKSNPHAYLFRALTHWSQGKAAVADRDLKSALQSGGRDPLVLNIAALFYATNTAGPLRNGRRAAELAQRAMKQTDGKDWRSVAVLAIAQAAEGSFATAAETAERAATLTTADNRRWCQQLATQFRAQQPLETPAFDLVQFLP